VGAFLVTLKTAAVHNKQVSAVADRPARRTASRKRAANKGGRSVL